jgi:Zn-dependent M28 family amino/carboxypeptidase
MAGGHSDSVEQGPGINDDGSGIIGVLDVALALTGFSTTNAVRFGFWSAEEFGLLGSEYYVSQLNQSAEEIAKVRAYLNFDMIASPNYYLAIYDGDGSDFNLTGPPGSAEIEAVFEDFYASKGYNSTGTAFDGRSDYGPFLENNIAAGGLFTGAEDVKTEEDVILFGGEAGIAYDPNYHAEGDTIDNLNMEAFLLNTQSIANSIALYATSLDSIPVRDPSKAKRSSSAPHVKRSSKHSHGSCGKDRPSI